MVQTINGDTPVFQLSVNQLLGILAKKEQEEKVQKPDLQDKHYVYGLPGLAKLLNCSRPTAQRIKDSGKIPFTQIGRKLIFDSEAVLKALATKRTVR